jgi:hypothetical protein
MTQITDSPAKSIEAMFVQSAHGLTSDGATITLQGVGHSTLFFADRPERVVGHLSSEKFVHQWGEGEDSFAQDPPNAVVAFLAAGDEVPEDVTVVLRDPRLHGDALTYHVDVLDGNLPAKADACSLFIDPIGRPLSPMSVAGVRRRDRRRDRR